LKDRNFKMMMNLKMVSWTGYESGCNFLCRWHQ
jgi:hypothetical protein